VKKKTRFEEADKINNTFMKKIYDINKPPTLSLPTKVCLIGKE